MAIGAHPLAAGLAPEIRRFAPVTFCGPFRCVGLARIRVMLLQFRVTIPYVALTHHQPPASIFVNHLENAVSPAA